MPHDDDFARGELETRGWTHLPRLDEVSVARLADVARHVEGDLVRRRARVEAGFYELWGYPERELQQTTHPKLAEVLAPFLERAVPDHRAILFNLWVKRERDDRSVVHFHQDFAFVDERNGRVGLQVWIPLVDVDEHNGALILVDRSHVGTTPLRALDHKHPLVTHSVTDLPPDGVQLRLAAGSGVLFTNRTAHASPPNTSDAPRFAVGAMLVPRDVPITCWFSRPPNRLELWTMTDAEFASHQPGELPAGATFVEAVDVAADAPSSRLDLGDGAWLCYRALPKATDKVVVTDSTGRFLLLDATEIDAIAKGVSDPNEPRRSRLRALGFLRAPSSSGDDDVVSTPPAPFVPTDLSTMTDDACDAVVESPGGITVVFDALRDVHAANRALTGAPPYEVAARWIRQIHARYAARGIGADVAYVNVVSQVTRATIAGGARPLVDAARELGIVYLELEPLRIGQNRPPSLRPLACTADEFLAFYDEAIRRVLEINEAGTLLIEKRLALHLEALVELAAGRRVPTAIPLGSSACGACAYDRYCGTTLVQRYSVAGDVAVKAWGGEFCRTSMGTLDAVFRTLASSHGAALRRVFKRWMEARDRVAARSTAARLGSPGSP